MAERKKLWLDSAVLAEVFCQAQENIQNANKQCAKINPIYEIVGDVLNIYDYSIPVYLRVYYNDMDGKDMEYEAHVGFAEII